MASRQVCDLIEITKWHQLRSLLSPFIQFQIAQPNTMHVLELTVIISSALPGVNAITSDQVGFRVREFIDALYQTREPAEGVNVQTITPVNTNKSFNRKFRITGSETAQEIQKNWRTANYEVVAVPLG